MPNVLKHADIFRERPENCVNEQNAEIFERGKSQKTDCGQC